VSRDQRPALIAVVAVKIIVSIHVCKIRLVAPLMYAAFWYCYMLWHCSLWWPEYCSITFNLQSLCL